MRTALTAILLIVPAAVAPAARGGDVRVETIDAQSIQGRLVSVTANKVVLTVGKSTRTFERDDLARIVLAAAGDPLTVKGRPVVVAATGEHAAAGDLTVGGGRINFTSPLLGKVSFSLKNAAAVYLPTRGRTPDEVRKKCERLKLSPLARDVVVVARRGGSWLAVGGVLKAADDKNVTLNWKGADRKISRHDARAIFLAQTGSAAERPKGVLVGADGSAVGFSSIRFEGGAFAVSPIGAAAVKVAQGRVAAVRFMSRRVVNLADLKPQSLKQYGLLDTVFAYKTNRAVGGRALTLGGRTYSSGLGLHSFCELTYRLDGAYSAFVAVVGIDDAARPHGDAELTFLGDGRELIRPLRLTGRKLPRAGHDKPQTVRLDLKGVKVLTIRAAFGPDGLDVGDHVDLAAARLIK